MKDLVWRQEMCQGSFWLSVFVNQLIIYSLMMGLNKNLMDQFKTQAMKL